VEINARLVGNTGVQDAAVMFRHVGEKDYKALPMGTSAPTTTRPPFRPP